MPRAFNCLGVRVDALDLQGAAEAVIRLGQAGGGAVHLCNAYVLSLAHRDAAYRDLLNRGTLNLADGVPVAWVGRRRGIQVEAVRGADLFVRVASAGVAEELRHYLYGSTKDVIEATAARLREAVPHVRIVGSEAPPFRQLSDPEYRMTADRIRASGANVVWVGTGTPRQDYFCESLSDVVPAACVAIGAAFDFIGGTKRQAPRWVQGSGLEWAHRLATEPRRLWKRYLFGNSVFTAGVLSDELKRYFRGTR